MEGWESCGLSYNYDEKCVCGHKCKEKKSFQMDAPSPPTLEEPILEKLQDTIEETHTLEE